MLAPYKLDKKNVSLCFQNVINLGIYLYKLCMNIQFIPLHHYHIARFDEIDLKSCANHLLNSFINSLNKTLITPFF